jgi:inorganic pyrophosphatase
VPVLVDRPLGSHHPAGGPLVYELNYGFVPGTWAPDGHPIDVHVLDAGIPLRECEAEVIAIVCRRHDVEDQLVARVGSADWSSVHLAARTYFQERFSESYVETAGGPGG